MVLSTVPLFPSFINDEVMEFQVAFEDGTSTSYAISSSQERGQMFIGPGVDVYKGQIVGIHQRPGDLSLNVCKKKAATNIRSNKEQTGGSSLYLKLFCLVDLTKNSDVTIGAA